MSLEQKINHQLNKHPWAKKMVKGVYQRGMYAFSPKVIYEGAIKRVTPADGKEYFFGYYDKSPWNDDGRYMICMRANNTWSEPDPKEEAELVLIDTQNDNHVTLISKTRTWNVQQGCMAQWLGPDFHSRIIFNDMRDGKYCSIIYNIETQKETVLPLPIYAVSNDGVTALSLDFSRLHNLRPGYGYSVLPEETKDIALPDATAVWKMNIGTKEVQDLFSYKDFADFEPTIEMQGAVHKVNHIMISPDGCRFMILHRWFKGTRKYTRLLTCNLDGTEMYCLNDYGASHCFWKNNRDILAFTYQTGTGFGYYLMKDRTRDYTHLWKALDNDGHPSYSPCDNSLVVTDTYPNRIRMAEVKLIRDTDVDGRDIKVIARVFAPFKYDYDTRCDLHPRWKRDGTQVCFDSICEGYRGLYVVEI